MLIRRTTAYSFIRFCASCSVALAFKLGTTWLLLHYMNAMLAYFFAHIATFFVSYLVHGRYSFKTGYGVASLLAYLRTVIIFKCTDYAIFSIAFNYFEISALWSVLVASTILLVLRFGMTKRAFQPTFDA